MNLFVCVFGNVQGVQPVCKTDTRTTHQESGQMEEWIQWRIHLRSWEREIRFEDMRTAVGDSCGCCSVTHSGRISLCLSSHERIHGFEFADSSASPVTETWQTYRIRMIGHLRQMRDHRISSNFIERFQVESPHQWNLNNIGHRWRPEVVCLKKSTIVRLQGWIELSFNPTEWTEPLIGGYLKTSSGSDPSWTNRWPESLYSARWLEIVTGAVINGNSTEL